jgi:hypothetical protein
MSEARHSCLPGDVHRGALPFSTTRAVRPSSEQVKTRVQSAKCGMGVLARCKAVRPFRQRPGCRHRRRLMILSQRLSACCSQPCLDGLPAIPHVPAHPIASWPVAVGPPAVQRMNGDTQHFRDIRQRQQPLTGLQRHDHLLSRSMQDLRAQPVDPAIASFDSVAHPCQQPLLFCKSPGRRLDESDTEDLSTLIT